MSTETKTTSTEFVWDNSPLNFALHSVNFLDHHLTHVQEQIKLVTNQLTNLQTNFAETTTMRETAFEKLKQEVEKFNASNSSVSLDTTKDLNTLKTTYSKYRESITQTA